jgi:hypothetical protein
VIPCSWHRRAATPSIGGRIIFFHGAQNQLRGAWEEWSGGFPRAFA